MEIEQKKFEAIKELADLTVKISDAKAILQRLEDTKTEYLTIREKKAKENIQKIIDESEEVLNKARNNYGEVHNMYNILKSYIVALNEGYETFKNTLDDFNERSVLWDKNLEKQHKALKELENQAEIDRKSINNMKKELATERDEIEKEKRKLRDHQDTLRRSIERLKQNKI